MVAQTTLNSATAWSPDIQVFKAGDVIPESLIFNATTVVTQELDGDSPAARIPWVEDGTADFVEEGAEIPEGDPELSETVVFTKKLAKLLRVSREQWRQDQTAALLAEHVQRAITNKGNEALLTLPEPGSGVAPTGLLNTRGMVTGDAITTNLDPLADMIGAIEAAKGTPSMILANPLAWATIRKLKTGDNDNVSLIGAGTTAEQLILFGLPVVKSHAMTEGNLAVIDRNAIASAVSPVQVAESEHFYFDSDSIALRCTWRFGWKVQHADRLGVVSVQTPAA